MEGRSRPGTDTSVSRGRESVQKGEDKIRKELGLGESRDLSSPFSHDFYHRSRSHNEETKVLGLLESLKILTTEVYDRVGDPFDSRQRKVDTTKRCHGRSLFLCSLPSVNFCQVVVFFRRQNYQILDFIKGSSIP